MPRITQSNEEAVDKARRVVAAKGKLRWSMLLYAAVSLGMCGYCTLAGIRKIEDLDGEQLRMGFVYGLGLAVVWTSFGIMGGLCLGKFLFGFRGDFRLQELLVCYHDRLRDLGRLPDEKNGVCTTSSEKVRMRNGDAMLIMVKGGEIIHFTPNMGLPHSEFVKRATGELPAGAWVGTVSKLDGRVAAISSKHFFGYQLPAPPEVAEVVRKTFE